MENAKNEWYTNIENLIANGYLEIAINELLRSVKQFLRVTDKEKTPQKERNSKA